MSKWTIYDRNGNALHESITEYNGDGKTIYQDTLDYSGKWMGERFLTVSIKTAYPIDFQVGDYIIYRGEKFTINYDPSVIKRARRGTYGEGFTYENIKFNSYSNELAQVKFHDWVLSDNLLHYTSLPTFSFYAKDVDDLVDRLQANMNKFCKDNNCKKEDYWMFYTLKNNTTTGTKDKGQQQTTYERTLQRAKDVLESCGIASTDAEYTNYINTVKAQWEKAYGVGDGYKDSRDDERYDRNISVNNQSVWDGVSMIKQQFGLNFIIRGRNVYIGVAGVPTSHIFKYGKGNGLYEVDKTADQDQKVVTRLHAYGSGDNLPTRYYAELNVQAFGVVEDIFWRANHEVKEYTHHSTAYYTEFKTDVVYKLGLFKTPTYFDRVGQKFSEVQGYIVTFHLEGSTDILTGMVEAPEHANVYTDNGDTSKVQIQMVLSSGTDAKNADWVMTDKTAFDKFAEDILAGKKIIFDSGVNTDSISAENRYYNTDNLPNNMSVTSLMLPGFPNKSLNEICRSEYDESTDTTNYYITNPSTKKETLFHSESGKHVITFSEDRHDPYITSPNADVLGILPEDISCTEENDDNGLEKVYPTIEEITDADAGIGSTGKRLDEVVKADKIDDNGVFPKSKVDEEKIHGFSIWLPELGFDLRQAAEDAGGSSMQIAMKDGFCGARTFSVTDCEQEKDGTWRLRCKRTYDDSLDLYFPYDYSKSVKDVDASMTNAYQIMAGDRYVLTGISVSDVNYVWAASVKLLAKAIHWLCKNDYTRYVYAPKIDEIYMAKEAAEADSKGTTSLHDSLTEGDIMQFEDDDLKIDGKVYIDQLNIKENGNNGIATYDVTLRNDVTVGTLQRIQNKVDSIANDVKTGNVGGGLTNATQVSALISTIGEQKFLSKTSSDTAKGDKYTFEHNVEVGGDSVVEGNSKVAGNESVSGNSTVDGNIAAKGGITIGPHGSYSITKEGIATLAGAVVDYLKSSDFTKGTGMGFDGSGFGITKDAKGKYTLEIDILVARIKMIAAELEVHEMSFIGGTVVMSSCGNRVAIVEALDGSGKVIATANSSAPTLTIPEGKVADKFRCYFLASDGDFQIKNEWTVGQLARCKTSNIAKPGDYSNYQNREYWRLVVAVSDAPVTIEGKSYHYIDISNSTSKSITLTDKSGTTHVVTLGGVCETMTSLPYAGDNVIGLGHCWDDKRQNAAILSMLEGGWVIYKGISAYDLPKQNIVNKFGIDETVITTDHFILRPYAAPSETQTVAVVRGAYDDAASYGHNDMVTLDGQTWIASGVEIGKTITGQKPSATSPYWSLAAAKGIQGEKGDGYSISFLLNDVPVDVINFDSVKTSESATLEADFFNNAVPVNVNKAVITCYDGEGNVLGSPIEVSDTNNIVADGGNLYLSGTCQYITTAAYDAGRKMLASKSIGIVKNGEKGEKGDQGIQGLQGLQGPQGNQGIPGPKGETGATGATGPQGPKGETGATGPKGADGVSTYFHIAYADDASGNGFSQSPTGKNYIGTYVDHTPTDSTKPSDYKWQLVKGAQGERGEKGIAGTNGTNGKTSYLHIAYANSADGKTGFDVSVSTGKLYIGQYVDFVEADSTDPTKYSWTKIKGEQGEKGAAGATGPQGPQGEKGATGATGPQGPQGAAGATGPQGKQGDKGDKGDSYSVVFKLNDVRVDVINFDDVTEMASATFEADFYNQGVAVNVPKSTLTCYDGDGNVLGSPIEVSDTNNIVADGGNLYLSANCKTITVVLLESKGRQTLGSASLGVIRNTITYSLTRMADTVAVIKPSDTSTSATFRLYYVLHYKATKLIGTVAHEATIATISANVANADGKDAATTVNGLEGTLSGNGNTDYTASNSSRVPNTIPVTVKLADGTVLNDVVPVTMQGGVAIDINNNINQLSVNVADKVSISTFNAKADEISLKVSDIENGKVDTALRTEADINMTGTEWDANTFYPLAITLNKKGEASKVTKFQILVSHQLETAYRAGAGYGTHSLGFNMLLSWQVYASGWGARDPQRVVTDYQKSWVEEGEKIAGSFGQFTPDSIEYVYLRGGAKWHITVFGNTDIAIAAYNTSTTLSETGTDGVVASMTLAPLTADKLEEAQTSLLATGIDIDSKTVKFTGSQFLWQNNAGEKVAYLDDGKFWFKGYINAQGGTFTGTVSAATITGGTINGTTITGSTITSTSSDGKSVTKIEGGQVTTNNLVANGGTIGGFNISQYQIGYDSIKNADNFAKQKEMSLYRDYIYFNSPRRRALLGCLMSMGQEMMESLQSYSYNTVADYGIVASIRNYANLGFGSNAVALHLNGCIEGLAVQTQEASKDCTIGKYTGSFLILGAGTKYYLPDMEPWDEGHVIKIKRLVDNPAGVKPQDDWTVILNAGKYNEYKNTIYLGAEATNPVSASSKDVGYSATDYNKVAWTVVEKDGMKLFHHEWQTCLSVDTGLIQTDLGIQSPGDAMTFVFHSSLTTTKYANCKGCWVQYKHPRDW